MVDAGEPVTSAYIDAADWEVEIAGRCYPATASLRPLYDPQMLRVKA
jgi:4-methylaminobutanoate oxidase (formaldehyde-forming)